MSNGRFSSILHPRRRSNSVQYDSGIGTGSHNSSLNSNLSLEHVQEEGDLVSWSTGSVPAGKPPMPGRRNRSASMSVTASDWGESSSAAILVQSRNVPIDYRAQAVPLIKSFSLPSDDSEDAPVATDPDSKELNMFVVEDPEQGYGRLLQSQSCYEAIPQNAKVVILDTRLPVKKAFTALINNCVRAALVWEGTEEGAKAGKDDGGHLIGVLAITDFIRVLLKFHDSTHGSTSLSIQTDETEALAANFAGLVTPPSSLPKESAFPVTTQPGKGGLDSVEKCLDQHEISTWRRVLSAHGPIPPLVTITSHESLFRATQLLLTRGVHRLPIVDPLSQNPLHILTLKGLLRFLWRFGKRLKRPESLGKTPRELGLGKWGAEVRTVEPTTPLLDCLRLLIDAGVSGLPVINPRENKVVDMYTRFDAIGIAADSIFDTLSVVTVDEALHRRKDAENFEGVVRCHESDSLASVIEKLVEYEVHRVVIVNGQDELRGLVALADVVAYLVLRPMDAAPSPLHSPTSEAPPEDMEWAVGPPDAEMESIQEEPC